MSDDVEGNDVQPVLEAEVQAELGKKLQQVYSDIVSEPVPDRFLDLLNQLEASESSSKN